MSQEVESRLVELVADLFQVDVKEVHLPMKPGDILRWDSLGHISLLEAIRKEFEIAIPLDQGLNAESLADLLAIIENLLAN